MADANIHINYTVEDIERYLNSGMNAKEMHDMEKAALQDPFLADAIEGYGGASMQQSHQHLNEITALLQKDKAEAKVVTMPQRNYSWIRIAAMLIAVVGVGVFSWYLIDLNKPVAENAVTAMKENEVTKTQERPVVKQADTALVIAQQKATSLNEQALEKPKLTHKIAPLTRNKAMETSIESKDNDVAIVAASVPEKKLDSVQIFLTDIAPGVEVSRADTKSAKIFSPIQGKGSASVSSNMFANNFSGYVLDDNHQPVPGAVVSANNKRATFTNSEGFFQLAAPDSILNVSVSSVGYETANANLSNKFANRIAISPSSQSLSEIVVTGYGSKRKQTEKDNKSRADSAFPSGGWESFQEYVYRKMNKPFDSANVNYTPTHGLVEIEFSIDSEGYLYNFNITQSSGKENDEKALNALKDGPRWISTKKNKKGKVSIRF